jgi:SagB-type dehydrogenase family enzyme
MKEDHGIDSLGSGSELWSLHEDVQVELESSENLLRVRSRWGDITIRHPSEPLRDALYRMTLGPISLDNVTGMPNGASLADAEAPSARYSPARIQLAKVLDRLQPLIIRSLGMKSGQPLLSVVPMTARARFHAVPVPPDAPVRLSTYAELRTNGREYSLESPLSLHRVVLHRSEAVALIGVLGRPVTAGDAAAAMPELASVAADALAYLVAAGMVVMAEGTRARGSSELPSFAEDADPALAGWSGLDLMFHTRRTLGRHDNAFGASYPLGRQGSPEPAVKPPLPGPSIPLHRPCWEDLAAADPALAVAMEGRRSMRVYGPEPVTAAELGAVLYRTARVRSLITPPAGVGDAAAGDGGGDAGAGVGDAGGGGGDAGVGDPRLSDRPYPGGGACYELELYVTVGRCEGIAPAVYHYDPLGHRLELVNSDRAVVDELLDSAGQIAVMDVPPPVLITLTARFRRLTWKYEGMAYAVALMNVGVLIQSLYLVCTAMNLAPCALGSVRIDATARAFGTDWRLEPTMGQLMLGRFPDSHGGYAGRWEQVNDAEWADLARAWLTEHRNREGADAGAGQQDG